MSKRKPAAQPAPPPAEELGLEELQEPDDQGLSLEELGQAYAALMQQGADPYQDLRSAPDEEPASDAEAETIVDEAPPQVLAGSDEWACEITPKSILEAILFVGHPADEPLTSQRIAGLMRGVRASEIDDLVRELNEQYDAEDAPYHIVSTGPGYRLLLRDEHAPLRDKFYGRVREARLSQAAIDVLAIVAYHQPVTQEEIDRLRGKPSGGLLSQMLRRDLLSVEKPADKKEKPKYRTTNRFLDLFGLDSVADLPRSQEADRNL